MAQLYKNTSKQKKHTNCRFQNSFDGNFDFTFLMAILRLENNGCWQKLPSPSSLENISIYTKEKKENYKSAI